MKLLALIFALASSSTYAVDCFYQGSSAYSLIDGKEVKVIQMPRVIEAKQISVLPISTGLKISSAEIAKTLKTSFSCAKRNYIAPNYRCDSISAKDLKAEKNIDVNRKGDIFLFFSTEYKTPMHIIQTDEFYCDENIL